MSKKPNQQHQRAAAKPAATTSQTEGQTEGQADDAEVQGDGSGSSLPPIDGDAERSAPGLVKMIRDPMLYPDPHTADVHPDEVGNFAAGGWVPAAEE